MVEKCPQKAGDTGVQKAPVSLIRQGRVQNGSLKIWPTERQASCHRELLGIVASCKSCTNRLR